MNLRYESACKYLKALESSLQAGWLQGYAGSVAGRADIFSRMALLHPAHLEDLPLPDYESVAGIVKDVQGPRSFPSDGLSRACESELLWGYRCPLDQADIHQDHLFPYSLGGPTNGPNRISLCRYHNMVKTCDIHCFPWETTESRCEPWLDKQISQLHERAFSRYQ